MKKDESIIKAARKQSEKLLDVASGLVDLSGKLAEISIAISKSADKGGIGFLEQQKELDHFRKEFSQFTKNNAAILRVTRKVPVGKPVRKTISKPAPNGRSRKGEEQEGGFVKSSRTKKPVARKSTKKKSVSK